MRHYHTNSKGAQEAHEAIRPTYVDRETIDDAGSQEKRLYALIRKRAIASQMADAEIEKTTADIVNDVNDAVFVATGEVVTFDGFLGVYTESDGEQESNDASSRRLPHLDNGQPLICQNMTAAERFTQQPPRFTEASLVKKLEELGIGRPSTYAPTISTIQQREYVVKGENEGTQRSYTVLDMDAAGGITRSEATETAGSDKGKLVPTDIGMIVNDFLTSYFPDILDYNFTARIEEKFDEIAGGKLPWTDEIATFYRLFQPAVKSAMTIEEGPKFGERIIGTDPESGETVSAKIGRFGPVVQIGSPDGDRKPRFASLLQGQSLSSITLEEALKLFEFPRSLGEFEGADVEVAIGRFGPYVRHKGKFVSIPKDMQPAEVSLAQAVELIEAKRKADLERIVRTFPEDSEIQILRGRYGIYIAKGKENYKIPKTVENPAALTLEQVRQIIEQADAAPAKPKRTRKK